MKILLLNGPPRAGKDTASHIILNAYPNALHDKFSAPIKRAFAATLNTSMNPNFEVNHYEALKEQTLPLFNVSYRQWQIDFSEYFMKGLYGQNIFGSLLVDRLIALPEDPELIVISDCGFQSEVNIIMERVVADTAVLRITRPGCDFKGDSRGFIEPVAYHIHNDFNLKTFEYRVLKATQEFLDS